MHPLVPPLPHPCSRRPRAGLAVAVLIAAAACAPQRPAAAPAPVPVVPPSAAAGVLGAPPPPTRGTGRAPADAARVAERPARTFAHTPGVTWDLDVLPYEGHERVQRYVTLFTGSARSRFTEWLRRGTRYRPMVLAKLRAGGLPEDLYYLALVESGYEPNAVSHAGAVGMWQFMAETGRDVGLRIDWWVDERRDPVRATDAAVRMMRWLRGQFGSLFVAAAAYNGGPGRVSRGIAQLAANDANAAAQAASAAALAAFDTAAVDAAPAGAPPAPPTPAVGDARFFALAEAGVLRSETVNYVPQLIAAALVAKEADRYGLVVGDADPLAYDEVRVPALTPLAAVAEVTGSTRAEILDLNPHLLRGMTPPGGATVVRVPDGAGEGAAEDVAALGEGRRAFRRVVTRKRDTWAALAERAGVSAAVLRAYNPGLDVVPRGKYRGRLVGLQAARVPTEAVQAYARAASWEGSAPGALPVMPAPPPEPPPPPPKPSKVPKRAPAAASTPSERAPAKRAAKGAAEESAEPTPEKPTPEKPTPEKPRSEKATSEKATSEKPAAAGARKAAPRPAEQEVKRARQPAATPQLEAEAPKPTAPKSAEPKAAEPRAAAAKGAEPKPARRRGGER